MAFFKYVLLAILGSNGTATLGTTPAGPSTGTVRADAVTQPGGGAMSNVDVYTGIGLLGQDTGGSSKQTGTGRKHKVHTAARQHRKTGHRHSKVTTGGKKPGTTKS
jgi:hypothetical protein